MRSLAEEGRELKSMTKRLEARLDESTDELIMRAAELEHVSKSAFVVRAARTEAERVVARANLTLMAPEVFDALVASLDVPDEAPELAQKLSGLPRLTS
jgi:uncharacterized protein (DUF1778 family)